MFAANPGLAIKTITASKGADYRPFAIEGAFGDIELKRLEKQVELIQETQALTHGDSTFGSADEDSERKASINNFGWFFHHARRSLVQRLRRTLAYLHR